MRIARRKATRPLELLSDGLSGELSVELGALDLDDVHRELAFAHAGNALKLSAKVVDLGTLLTNDNAGASGEDDDLHLVASALDLNAGDGGAGKTLLEILTDLKVVTKGLGVVLSLANQRERQFSVMPRRKPVG